MVDNKSCLKYKYLTFKVQVERNKPDAIYKWTYTVTGIGPYENINVLGFYDEKMTCPIFLMSNKSIYEYDWTTVYSRIFAGIYKAYLDMFQDNKHIIIISDAVTFELSANPSLTSGIEQAGFKLSHQFEGYTLQFVNPDVYTIIENDNYIFDDDKPENVKKVKRMQQLDEEWKRRYGKIPENDRPMIGFPDEMKEAEKKSKKSILHSPALPAVAMVLFLIGIIAASVIGSNAISRFNQWMNKTPQSVVVHAVYDTTTQKSPYSRAESIANTLDSMSVFEPPLDIKSVADSIYKFNLIHRADSIAKIAIKRDSIIAELPKEKKVQVELTAVIEDGVTTRKVQTGVVLDTIRESDMRHLTKTITEMATNMAKDRQAEIDTSKTYYKVSKNFIRME